MALLSNRLLANGLMAQHRMRSRSDSAPANVAPTAEFSSVEAGLQSTFTDESTDSDGTIASWAWNFGDSNTSTEQNPVHTYATSGTYSVTLTVTDNDGGTDDVQHDVTVIAYADITWALLTASSSTANTASYATASISPAANKPVYLGVVTNQSSGTAPNPTVTGNGLTWELVDSVDMVNVLRRLSVYRAAGATPSAGAVTIDYGATAQNSACWAIVQATGADLGGTNGSASVVQSDAVNNAVAGTTVAGSLAAFGNAKNQYLAFVSLNTQATVTADPQFTTLGTANIGSSSLTIEVEHAVNQTTCDPTFASAVAAIVSLEIKAAVV